MLIHKPPGLFRLPANAYHRSFLKPCTQRFFGTKQYLLQNVKVCSRKQLAHYRYCISQQQQQISNSSTFISGQGAFQGHQSIRQFSADDYGLDRLRTDVERSFTVNDSDNDLVHGVGIGKKGKTLVFPFSNPKKGLLTSDKDDVGDSGMESTQKGTDQKSRVPSVTTILSKSMPMASFLALKRWEEKMIKEIGEKAFQEYRRAMLSSGKKHHKNIEAVLSGSPESEIPVTKDIAGYWKSMKHVLADIDHVECMEKMITHPYLGYRGIVDCVGNYKRQRCVIEWKTSRRQRSTLKQCYDNPLQAVAYAGALNYDANFKQEVTQALIVIAYEDGKRAHTHFMSANDCEKYWSEWLTRILKYREAIKKEENV